MILERLREIVPEFFADEDVAYDMGAAVAANVRRSQHLLAHSPVTKMSEGLPIEAADLLESTIQHGIPLISLLEAYRAAQGLALDWWQRRLEQRATPDLLPIASRILGELIVTYIDTAATQIRASYEHQRRTLDNSLDGRRAHLIRRLLAGEPLDLDAAARTLNHPLTVRHVALVLWRTDQHTDTTFAEVLATLTDTLGPVRALSMPATRQRTYAWLSTTGPLELGPLRNLRTPPGVRVATSAVHTGLAGFVQAHLDAVRTAAVIREGRSPDTDRIATYEQYELLALLSRDPDDRDRFVKRALGPIAYDDPEAERARHTLRAFLASGSSPSRAAKRLGVHRNTVTYRLSALTDLVTTADADSEAQAVHRLELELALHIAEQLGPLTKPALIKGKLGTPTTPARER